MNLNEFDEFEFDPSIETAMAFGKAITETDGAVEEKRMLFQDAFGIAAYDEPLEAVVNMWAVASMLEAPLSIPQKVSAVRGFLKDPNITPEMIEVWAWTVYTVARAPQDLLEFIAVDIRNQRGVSTELRRMLGHPSPEEPFRDG